MSRASENLKSPTYIKCNTVGSAWVGEAVRGSEKVISDQNMSPSRRETDFCCNRIVTKITLCFNKSGVYNYLNEFV